MSEYPPQPEVQKSKIAVERVPRGKGAIYVLYFSDRESAHELVRDFWIKYSEGRLANNIDEGRLEPAIHEITEGPRTSPRENLMEFEKRKYPGMKLCVEFNGNTNELSERAEQILQEVLKEYNLISE